MRPARRGAALRVAAQQRPRPTPTARTGVNIGRRADACRRRFGTGLVVRRPPLLDRRDARRQSMRAADGSTIVCVADGSRAAVARAQYLAGRGRPVAFAALRRDADAARTDAWRRAAAGRLRRRRRPRRRARAGPRSRGRDRRRRRRRGAAGGTRRRRGTRATCCVERAARAGAPCDGGVARADGRSRARRATSRRRARRPTSKSRGWPRVARRRPARGAAGRAVCSPSRSPPRCATPTGSRCACSTGAAASGCSRATRVTQLLRWDTTADRPLICPACGATRLRVLRAGRHPRRARSSRRCSRRSASSTSTPTTGAVRRRRHRRRHRGGAAPRRGAPAPARARRVPRPRPGAARAAVPRRGAGALAARPRRPAARRPAARRDRGCSCRPACPITRSCARSSKASPALVADAEIERRRGARLSRRSARSPSSPATTPRSPPRSTQLACDCGPAASQVLGPTDGRALVHAADPDTLADALAVALPRGARPSAGSAPSSTRLGSDHARRPRIGPATPPVPWPPWRPTRSASSATRCSSGRPRAVAEIDGALGRSSSTRCTRRCTTRPVSAWPRRRSACSSASSSTTSATTPARTSCSIPRSSRRPASGSTRRAASRCPGLAFEIVRPKVVTVQGLDLDGNEVVVEGDELLGRVFLHEIDHLDGVLMLDRLDARPSASTRCASCASRAWACRRPAAAGTRSDGAGRRPRVDAPRLSRHSRATRFRRCARSSPPATTSRSSSRNPTGAVRAARARDPSPVKRAATELGLPVRTPGEGARGRRRRRARAAPKLGVVVAFGQLLPVALLEALPLGFVNLHFSLLPRWRGAAPVERAMLAGDARDRRLPDAARSRPRHRSGVRVRRARRSMPPRPRASCATGWSTLGTALLVEHLPRLAGARARAAASASRPTPTSSTVEEFRARPGAARGRARPRRARRQPAAGRVGARRRPAGEGVRRAPRRPNAPGPRRRDRRRGRSRTADGDAARSTRCSPRASARMAWAAWRRGHPRRPRDRRVSTAVQSARRVALDALLRIEDGAFAHILVPGLLGRSKLTARDRGFVTELVYGTVRMQRALDFLLAKVSKQAIRRSLEPEVRAALRLGAYQLLHRHPAARGGRRDRRRRRRARTRLRERCAARARAHRAAVVVARRATTIVDLGVRTSHPDWIVRMLVDEFGRGRRARDARARQRTAAGDAARRTRCARRSPTSNGELRDAGIDVRAAARSSPTRSSSPTRGDLGALARDPRRPRHAAGSGEPGRRRRARSRNRASGCSTSPPRPGGKATASAERMRDDRARRRGRRPRGSRARARPRRRAASGSRRSCRCRRRPARRCVRPRSFDRVLLDAPCSGLGVLRRRPDARWRVRPSDVRVLAELQRELLVARRRRGAARRAARVRGVHAQPEGDAPDRRVRGVGAPRVRRDDRGRRRPWRPHGRGALLLPSDARTDGMFVLVLERAR